MASETLTGCVDWSTGDIIFDQDSCSYTGCIEWTGVHAGQVAVSLNTNCCKDVYYGCVDWSDGRFKVTVPDDCCLGPKICPCDKGYFLQTELIKQGYNCPEIFQPSVVQAVNYGIGTYCDGAFINNPNDDYSAVVTWDGLDGITGSNVIVPHYSGCAYVSGSHIIDFSWRLEKWRYHFDDPGNYKYTSELITCGYYDLTVAFIKRTNPIENYIRVTASGDARCRSYDQNGNVIDDYYATLIFLQVQMDWNVNLSSGKVIHSGSGVTGPPAYSDVCHSASFFSYPGYRNTIGDEYASVTTPAEANQLCSL